MQMQENHKVYIFTDGASVGNPGPGGWAAVIREGSKVREISGGFRRTTNNRMELYAAIQAIKTLPPGKEVELISDSKYLIESINTGRVDSWRAKGWRHASKRPVPNADLWKTLAALLDLHRIQLTWVRGHSGHKENERANYLAQQALLKPGLPPDEGYEISLNDNQPGLFADGMQPDGQKRGQKSDRQNRPQAEEAVGVEKKLTERGNSITREGQACRKCGTAVIKKTPKRKAKPGQKYYYAYYFSCPNCGTNYLIEDAKVWL